MAAVTVTVEDIRKELAIFAERGLEAHEITAACMAMENNSSWNWDVNSPAVTEMNTTANMIRASVPYILMETLAKSVEYGVPWGSYSKLERKVFNVAKNLVILKDALELATQHKSMIQEDLEDEILDKEFELQYLLIKLVPKSRRGW